MYQVRHTFDEEPSAPELLDVVARTSGGADRFGSYQELIQLKEYRYEGERAPKLDGPTLDDIKQRQQLISLQQM